jgi:hypothetical protein
MSSTTALGAVLVAASLGIESTSHATQTAPVSTTQKVMQQMNPYIGMWVTGDGRIRQELLPNGRYDEARGARKSAYQGRYEIQGNRINYWDDTGFTADGVFVDANTLHHGGMIFYREPRS